MDKKNIRNSNFELLRIILIMMVIVLHYLNARMGGAMEHVSADRINYYLIHFIKSACIIAVDTFVLITGYFMCQKSEIKVSKVVKLFYLSFIYGIIIFLGCYLLGKTEINMDSIHTAALTITDRWFVVIYCILYLLIPYINKLIQSINKKQFSILLGILIVFFYIWPTVWTNITIKDNGYGIINFMVLYLIGAYIKLYHDDFKSFFKSGLLYVTCTVITTVLSLFSTKAFLYNSIINLISSIAMFEMFKGLDIKNNKIINRLATYTFSTYIIHENSLIVTALYREVFHSNDFWESRYLIVNLILTTLGIYALCIVIEWIRRMLMERHVDKWIDKINYQIKL